jgi:hypothetical protein
MGNYNDFGDHGNHQEAMDYSIDGLSDLSILF